MCIKSFYGIANNQQKVSLEDEFHGILCYMGRLMFCDDVKTAT